MKRQHGRVQNAMFLSKTESQHLYFGPTQTPNLLFPNSTGSAVHLPKVHCTMYLGLKADHRRSTRRQQIPGRCSPFLGVLTEGSQFFHPFFSTMLRPHLELCVQVCAFILICDIAKLRRLRWWPPDACLGCDISAT